jgi:alpha-tubulin suppressor-like RCC1 family protein
MLRTTGDRNCAGEVAATAAVGTTAPVAVAAVGNTVAELAASFRWHTCARRTDGSVWCWGANDYGQVGTGAASQYVDRPTRVNF